MIEPGSVLSPVDLETGEISMPIIILSPRST